MEETKTWRVRVYNDDDVVIDTWLIADRTQDEARKEAESEVEHRHPECGDWTMMIEKGAKHA
jgi:hypothetical protein